MNQKYTKLDGTVSIYKVKNKKWIKSNARYKPQTRGSGKKVIHSTRFGYLEQFNRKEQQGLLCPSGYSISQCFNVLRKLWNAYHISRSEKNIKRMIKYAKAIQDVQKDMGIKTTSFPDLLLYGDVFMLLEHKNQKAVTEDHSELLASQQLLEKKHEIITLADEIKIMKKEKEELELEEEPEPPVPLLLTPTVEQEIQVFADEIPIPIPVLKPLKTKLKLELKQSKKNKVKHENTICIKCGEKLELEEKHECKKFKKKEKEKEKELEVVIMTDDIPFQNQNQTCSKATLV
ncbi:MAG: hypothetical protein WBN72_05015 [Nitrososphaeraceae archaeon]